MLSAEAINILRIKLLLSKEAINILRIKIVVLYRSNRYFYKSRAPLRLLLVHVLHPHQGRKYLVDAEEGEELLAERDSIWIASLLFLLAR